MQNPPCEKLAIELSTKICNYINEFNRSSAILDRLHKESSVRKNVAPHIGPHTGALLAWLIKLIDAKSVLEFGSCIGYSTITLGQAAKHNNGKLISIELSKEHYEETLKNIKEAGLEDTITLINGDVEKVVEELSGPFDFILQDAAKLLYPKILERCVKILRKGGILAADDTLFKPMGFKENVSCHIHKYNELVFSHPNLDSVLLPIGDGITLSTKK